MDNPSTTMKTRRYVSIIANLSAASFVLQLIGFVTPGWMIMTIDSSTISVGLWYMRVCAESNTCMTKAYAEIEDQMDNTPGLKEIYLYQGLATTAIITILISTVAFVRCYITLRRTVDSGLGSTMILGGICVLISGILVIACAGKWADAIRIANDYLHIANVNLDMSVPYSLILSGLGGMAAVLATAVLIFSRAWSMSPNVTSGGNSVDMPPVYFENPISNGYTNMGQYSDKPGY